MFSEKICQITDLWGGGGGRGRIGLRLETLWDSVRLCVSPVSTRHSAAVSPPDTTAPAPPPAATSSTSSLYQHLTFNSKSKQNNLSSSIFTPWNKINQNICFETSTLHQWKPHQQKHDKNTTTIPPWLKSCSKVQWFVKIHHYCLVFGQSILFFSLLCRGSPDSNFQWWRNLIISSVLFTWYEYLANFP